MPAPDSKDLCPRGRDPCGQNTTANSNKKTSAASGHGFCNAGKGKQNNNLGCGNQYNADTMNFCSHESHDCPKDLDLEFSDVEASQHYLHRNSSDFQRNIEGNRMFLKGTMLRVIVGVLKQQLGLFLLKCTMLLVITGVLQEQQSELFLPSFLLLSSFCELLFIFSLFFLCLARCPAWNVDGSRATRTRCC
ncbi:hypothetical protein Egran_00034 [Elaphomyces granulatus]|uniref:Uncharacterized protein n=1 Tax=Elaphomyces granulatus TaxID=519963 RepID=A0A232M707_9EURO|nr:hypothetical protein Egran_00034 [Elaphomyces granulatus]